MSVNQKKNVSETVLTIVVGLLVFYFIFDIRILLLIALILGLTGVFIPYFAEKIHWLWIKLSEILGLINGRILLSIIFFIFLLPISLIRKVVVKNLLYKDTSPSGSCYYERNHAYSPEDFENIW